MRLTIDIDERCFEVETPDGVVHRQEAGFTAEDPMVRLPPDFRRVSYDTDDRLLTLTPQVGDPFEVEVFDGGDQRERRAGRHTIYLDQNKWILLGRAVHAQGLVPRAELSAAKELIHLAETQQVILPLSSGHLIEIARADGPWRSNLAPIMVRLSRGWLLRDPLLVRRTELGAMFQQRAGLPPGAANDVVTLDPAQLYAEAVGERPTKDHGLPAEMQVLADTLATTTAIFAVLLEDEVTHSERGYEMASAWAEAHHTLAIELRTNTRARSRSRDVTRAMFLSDLGADLAEAVAASDMRMRDFDTWLADEAEQDLQNAPYLGRMRDVIHFRLRNSEETWEPNDLIDMNYLPLAAAYTDYVVAENQTRHYLLRAQRTRTGGAKVMSSIAQLVDDLRE